MSCCWHGKFRCQAMIQHDCHHDKNDTDSNNDKLTYLTEQMDHKLRKNILLRLWTGCMEAAKAIRFSYVANKRWRSN